MKIKTQTMILNKAMKEDTLNTTWLKNLLLGLLWKRESRFRLGFCVFFILCRGFQSSRGFAMIQESLL